MKIEINNYSKTLGKEEILKNINLTFTSGNIYGIVGRNGSGKSILLKSICGFANIKKGSIKIDNKILGKDIEFSNDIGAVLDGAGFLNNLTGFKNLKILADITGKISDEKIIETMKLVGLEGVQKKKYKHYSMGMKQKLAICQAIMEEPQALILDEVFNGLDKESVIEIRQLLKKYKKDKKLVIITSHIIDDINLLCDEVYEINNGEINIINSSDRSCE